MLYWQSQKKNFWRHGTIRLQMGAWLLLVILGGGNAPAIQTDPNLSQLMHQQWQTEDGLPQNAVHCLAQDHRGFIWFGTENGLVRFDGISFDVFTERQEPKVPHNFVSSLLVARDGTVWAGTRTGGLCRYRDEKFEIPAPEFAEAKISALAESSDGHIWAATTEGILRWDGKSVVKIGKEAGLPSNDITALFFLPDGTLLAGTREGDVVRRKGASFEILIRHPVGTQGMPVKSLAYDETAETIWVAHDGAGLFSFRANELTRVDLMPQRDLEFLRVLLLDKEGALWIGTETDGIVRLKNGTKSELSATSDFPDNDVLSLLQDKERSIWVGTHFSGLNRLRKGKAVTLTEREGLTSPTVTCVVQEDSETLWIGTKGGGLMKFSELRFTSRSLEEEKFPARADVRALLRSSTGELWIGTYGGGLGRLRANGDLRFFTVADGLSENLVSSLIEVNGDIWIGSVQKGISVYETGSGRIRQLPVPDFLRTHIRAFARNPAGGLWIATQNGLVSYTEGRFTQVQIPQVPDVSARALLSEEDGTLWVGTRDDGLLRIRAGQAEHFNSKKGLIHNRVYHILATTNELYLAGNQGIERISRSNLEAVADQRENRLNTRLYGKREGLRSSECGEDSNPSALLASDGSMWFGTREGLAYLTAPTPGERQEPPNVLVKSVTVDDRQVSAAHFQRLLPGQSRLQFDYTALSLRNPANVFFKYKLDNVDQRWVEAGRAREAVYYNLKPGSYHFRVQACNDEGIWNETGATLAFAVLPTIYQTVWFRAFGAIAASTALVGAFRWRVRQIRSRNRMLQTLVKERTKELQVLNEELENRVRARTAELRGAYENLQIELHERQEAEQALARSEARLRRMVDSGMVGILFWHRSGAITEANETFLKMVGYTPEELEKGQLSWNRLTPPEYLDLDAAALEEIERTGVCTPFEKEYVRKDGSRLPILIGGASLGMDSDKGVCFVLDISKLKETEEEIRQLNLKLEARVQERTLELAHTNEQLAAEVQERKRVGVALAAFSRLGQDLHAARTEKEAAQIVAQTAKSLIPHDVCSIELYTADGQLSPMLDSSGPGSVQNAKRLKCSISVPIRNGSRVVGVLGLMNSQMRDFDSADSGTLQALGDYCGGALERIHAEEARRETERRFATFMTNAPALAWMKDAQFRYVFTNAMFQRFLGLGAEEIEGKSDYNLWPDQVAFTMRTNDTKAVKSQTKLETQEQLKRFDGEARTLLTLRFLFTTATGEQYVAGMAVDITEQKRAEEALHRLPQSIIEAQETERRRVARELHDGVNQAIASIKFRIQTAEQQILRADPKWQETCSKTKDMLDSVLHQVRRLSRNLRPGELDDFGLIPAARSACQEFELRSGVHVRFTHSDFAERLSPTLELSLYRVIQEALTNVEKHSGATAVEIHLQGEETMVTLEISDNGCGFERSAEVRPDAGLGLLHMRERASLVGGIFSMITSPGKGLHITIQAPIVRAEEVVS